MSTLLEARSGGSRWRSRSLSWAGKSELGWEADSAFDWLQWAIHAPQGNNCRMSAMAMTQLTKYPVDDAVGMAQMERMREKLASMRDQGLVARDMREETLVRTYGEHAGFLETQEGRQVPVPWDSRTYFRWMRAEGDRVRATVCFPLPVVEAVRAAADAPQDASLPKAHIHFLPGEVLLSKHGNAADPVELPPIFA